MTFDEMRKVVRAQIARRTPQIYFAGAARPTCRCDMTTFPLRDRIDYLECARCGAHITQRKAG